MFGSSDEDSPMPDSSPLCRRAELPSPAEHHIDYHHAPTPGTDYSFQDVTAEEDFPTAPLDDDIWFEDLVPDRHLCIHEQSQPHFLCSYPYPYSLDLLPYTPKDTPASYYEMIVNDKCMNATRTLLTCLVGTFIHGMNSTGTL